MKPGFFYFLLVPCLLLLCLSCSKDNEPVDVRDELVGSYEYRSGNVGGLSNGLIIDVSKHSTHQDRLTFYFSTGDFSFYAQDIERHPKGITFRVPPQLVMVSGLPMMLEGKELVSIAEILHQGVYTPSDRHLNLGLQLAIMTPSGPGRAVSGLLLAERKP